MKMRDVMTELFLVNGSFYTQDPTYPHVTAIAIRDGRFWAVGSDEEIRALAAGSVSSPAVPGATSPTRR